MLAHASTCAPSLDPPTIAAGQLWRPRSRVRNLGYLYRVLWVSDYGQHVRIIRTGGHSGRYLPAAELFQRYSPLRRSV